MTSAYNGEADGKGVDVQYPLVEEHQGSIFAMCQQFGVACLTDRTDVYAVFVHVF